VFFLFFFFSSRRRHTRSKRDWSSDVCSSDLTLFPMVILTGMIERFWTLEVEDGTASSFKTLFGTMIIAATISVVVSIPAVVSHRSEERRVGKECRSRRARCQSKKK